MARLSRGGWRGGRGEERGRRGRGREKGGGEETEGGGEREKGGGEDIKYTSHVAECPCLNTVLTHYIHGQQAPVQLENAIVSIRQ